MKQVGFIEEDINGDESEEVEEWIKLFNSIQPPLLLVTVTDTVLTPSSTSNNSTSTSTKRRSYKSSIAISIACTRLHIPLNITDYPSLSTFSFPAVHRFPSTSNSNSNSNSTSNQTKPRLSNLQIAISTNGQGCRLAGRIKRDLIAGKVLSKDVGGAVDMIGVLRRRVKEMMGLEIGNGSGVEGLDEGCDLKMMGVVVEKIDGGLQVDEDDQTTFIQALNSPVPQLSRKSTMVSSTSVSNVDVSSITTTTTTPTPSIEEEQLRRMKWISQISEYWSMEYLAKMGGREMEQVLGLWDVERVSTPSKQSQDSEEGRSGSSGGTGNTNTGSVGRSTSAKIPSFGNGSNPYGGSEPTPGLPITPRHELALGLPPRPPTKRGRILLLGSGPGHPSLLTVAAHRALQTSTLILSDKLVPSEILALIPSTTTLHIAKKFPGNAEGAQNEMMDLALQGAIRGEVVVRLKQGDPFVYGRGGEEVLFFRQHGFEPVVVPGVSSALAGPLMMGIPVTQRGVAESMVLCTGVGRKGKAVQLPGYVRGRTLVVLMGVARIRQVIDVLTRQQQEGEGGRDGAAYPSNLPIAIIERASSHDQRMVASTLAGIEDALINAGDQRPPGMMIIGWAVLALEGEGEVTVLDDDDDDDDVETSTVVQHTRDQARVDRWLGGKPFILKDGLGDEWAQFLTPEAAAQVEQVDTIDTYAEYNKG